ncbi:MAG: hypothetical protein MI724_05585 [Spirochaetales bacterium]|nr:hypothetical protein [Spirochaetales bacterium]
MERGVYAVWEPRVTRYMDVESSILDMTDRERAIVFRNASLIERSEMLYDKYVRGNPELEATVGLPENLVFEGFEGPVLEAEPSLF